MTNSSTLSPRNLLRAGQKYAASIERIRALDGGPRGLNAVSAILPEPPAVPTGRMAGLSVALKDNIDVVGVPTTAGSLALEGAMPVADAPIVDALRGDGAVIVAKTHQLELSGWVTFSAPAGYSALGGRALNPHDPRLTTGGSSSGAAVAAAAGYVDVAIGTDTGGSVLGPAGLNGVWGLRPTVGRVSTGGIVPVSSHQDTPGPLSRSSRTLAATTSTLLGAGGDAGFEERLDDRRLSGLRVGVPILDHVGDHEARHWRERLLQLRERGAVLVPLTETVRWRGHGDLTVPTYDFREGLQGYLAGLSIPSGVFDITSLVEHYLSDRAVRMPYGADNLLRSASIDLERDRALRDSVWRGERGASRAVLDTAREEQGVEIVLFPAAGAAYTSSKSGYPALAIPGRVGLDARMHFTTALATAPGAEQTLLDLAWEIESTIGAPIPAPLDAAT